jgi:hypothetical protein
MAKVKKSKSQNVKKSKRKRGKRQNAKKPKDESRNAGAISELRFQRAGRA